MLAHVETVFVDVSVAGESVGGVVAEELLVLTQVGGDGNGSGGGLEHGVLLSAVLQNRVRLPESGGIELYLPVALEVVAVHLVDGGILDGGQEGVMVGSGARGLHGDQVVRHLGVYYNSCVSRGYR